MDFHLAPIESRFADIIWKNEPLASSELARIALEEIGWKKSTSYTVLKRICDRGLFKNEKGIVTSNIKREEFYTKRGEMLIDEAFTGSLPAFIAAFASKKGITPEEAESLRKIISEYEAE